MAGAAAGVGVVGGAADDGAGDVVAGIESAANAGVADDGADETINAVNEVNNNDIGNLEK